ncbi:hypothetical protein F0562_000166 [Nyssa sinensis]|uniref:Uncharacterized protein n=1 Tax=Nyssa sinensis TaxID=561372 RepID=A0A5J5C3R0_9ASTE|nr:hypothetical protein F0562_000166 [Nyssa sinensis]
MHHKQHTNGEGSVHLPIESITSLAATTSAGPTIFEPQSSIEKRDSSNANSVSPTRPPVRAPEKELTLFAFRLAVLEKAATGLGTLGFIWATVVLLGGFAITLDKTDFWFITIILLIEGTRIFSRSHELEWQHQATWSITDAGINSFRAIRSSSHFIYQAVKAILRPIDAVRKQSRHSREITESTHPASRRNWNERKMPTRTWKSSDVPLLPYAQWVFLSRNISKLLYWLQLASATACVVLSLMKLIKHNYGEVAKGDTDKINRRSALNIFYALALAEATLFLLEKAYWEWKVIVCKELEQVNKECELGPSGMISIKRFFYDAYSRCVEGSIFDGLQMDMVSFAMDLLASNSPDEQLIGVQILRTYAKSERYSEDTLQKIGTTFSVMERLVEMLNWKDPQEEEIRESAAGILSKLASKKQNSLRVAGIPGAMESISSLLHNNRSSSGAADEICEKNIVCDHENYGFWTFNHLGLIILKKLARDHDNCGKIGNSRGLLQKIIGFTHAGERLLKDETVSQSQILTVKRSLQVVKMLASTTGITGKQLRREISEGMPKKDNHVRIAAGEALAMLALESRSNCDRILKLKATEKLIGALEVPLLRVNAAGILRNLCTYSGGDCFTQLRGVTTAAPTVLKAIMLEENKLQEVMVGLAAQVFKFMTSKESSIMFETAGIQEAELARALVHILKKHQYPSIKIPRIRRFVIELAIWMMRGKETTIQIFKILGMEDELECVSETTSELESFDIFSGAVGMSRHSTTIHSLVETAMKLLEVK